MNSLTFSIMVQWSISQLLRSAPDMKTMQEWFNELRGEYTPYEETEKE